jgi:hypothetical protein
LFVDGDLFARLVGGGLGSSACAMGARGPRKRHMIVGGQMIVRVMRDGSRRSNLMMTRIMTLGLGHHHGRTQRRSSKHHGRRRLGRRLHRVLRR